MPEWGPVTNSPVIATLFFLTAAIVVWSFVRHRSQTTLWERAATLLLAVGAIVAVRNVVWFNLAMVVLLPLVDRRCGAGRRGRRRSHPRLNLAIVAVATVVLVLAAAASASRSPTERYYPAGGLAAVRRAVTADPSLRVFADERYADWLLWRLPALRGRVAYDARFELLSDVQLAAIADFKAGGRPELEHDRVGVPAAGARSEARRRPRDLEHAPGARVLFDRDGMVVILRSACCWRR